MEDFMGFDRGAMTRGLTERGLKVKNGVLLSLCSLPLPRYEGSQEGIKPDSFLAQSSLFLKIEVFLIGDPYDERFKKISSHSPLLRFSKSLFFSNGLFKIRKNVWNGKPDFIQIPFSLFEFWNIFGILLLQGPIVISLEGLEEEILEESFYPSLMQGIFNRLIFARANFFLCNNNKIMKWFNKRYGIPRKKFLLMNSTDLLDNDWRNLNDHKSSSSKYIQKNSFSIDDILTTLYRDINFQNKRRVLTISRKAVGRLFSRKIPPSGTLRILMYHRVDDVIDSDILTVTPFAFVQQMIWLREEGWQVLSLREALLRLENGSLPPKSVAITFDDGYADNYEKAYPILLRLGFSATIFPVTGFVLGESEHRRYRGRDPKVPYLSMEQIREMKETGIDFGGHTHTHPLLSTISCEAAQEEILRAKKLLEEWTGEKSTLFAYPNGIYGKEHFRILDALGYEAALTVRPGANRPGTYRFALLRTEVSGRDSLGDFIRKMNGGFDLMHRMTQGVRGFYR